MACPAFIYLARPQPKPKNLTNSSTVLDQKLSKKMSLQDDEIPDPNTPGVWWKDNSKWVLYDDQIIQKILSCQDVGSRKIAINRMENSADSSSSYSYGTPEHEFEVDFISLKEVHLESRAERDIKIVRVPFKECIFYTYATSNDSIVKFSINVKNSFRSSNHKMKEMERHRVSWMHETGGWCLYSHDKQMSIWSAWAKGDHFVYIDNVASLKYPNGVQYMIDFIAMQQKNVATGSKRPVQIALWICSSTRNMQQMWNVNHLKYSTQEIVGLGLMGNEIMLYRLALSRLVCREYVTYAISRSIEPHKLQSMEMNNHFNVSENELWDRFLHSFMQTMRDMPEYLGHIWRFALNPDGPHDPASPFAAANSNGLWRFVFCALSDLDGHDANVLLKSGTTTSSSTKYSTCAGWFGVTSTITELHCKPVSPGVVSMLVFLAVMPQNFNASEENVVFIKKTKDHLPIASITVSLDKSSLGPSCSLWEDMNEEESSASSSWKADHDIDHLKYLTRGKETVLTSSRGSSNSTTRRRMKTLKWNPISRSQSWFSDKAIDR